MSRVADDFYLIAHDEWSGRSQIAPRAVRLGLAAAILAELMLDGHLRVWEGGLFPGEASLPPEDRMLRHVLTSVQAPLSERSVEPWLAFLAIGAVDLVRGRLVAEGLVTPVMVRNVVGRRQCRHLPTNRNIAAWPSIRLAKHLSAGLVLSAGDLMLTGLVEITGLLGAVLWCKLDHVQGWDRAGQVRGELPADLAALVAFTDAAIRRSARPPLRRTVPVPAFGRLTPNGPLDSERGGGWR